MASMPGVSQQVHVGDTVYLDGSASQSSTYRWGMTQVPSGSHCLMRDDGTATPSFVADMAGEYVLTLETDGGQTATVSIQACPRDDDPDHEAEEKAQKGDLFVGHPQGSPVHAASVPGHVTPSPGPTTFSPGHAPTSPPSGSTPVPEKK